MEDLKEFLNKEFLLYSYLTEEQIKDFYRIMEEYLHNRSKIQTLKSNLEELKVLFYAFGLNDLEIIAAIKSNPSYIHADKNDLLIKFFLLGKVIDKKTRQSMRKEIIIGKGKYLRTSHELIYARIKHLEYLQENNDIIRNKDITVRKIFKVTNEEFEITYGISRENLLKRYPFTNSTIIEIENWVENKELKEIIHGKN